MVGTDADTMGAFNSLVSGDPPPPKVVHVFPGHWMFVGRRSLDAGKKLSLLVKTIKVGLESEPEPSKIAFSRQGHQKQTPSAKG